MQIQLLYFLQTKGSASVRASLCISGSFGRAGETANLENSTEKNSTSSISHLDITLHLTTPLFQDSTVNVGRYKRDCDLLTLTVHFQHLWKRERESDDNFIAIKFTQLKFAVPRSTIF